MKLRLLQVWIFLILSLSLSHVSFSFHLSLLTCLLLFSSLLCVVWMLLTLRGVAWCCSVVVCCCVVCVYCCVLWCCIVMCCVCARFVLALKTTLCVHSKRSRVCRRNDRVLCDTGVLTAHTVSLSLSSDIFLSYPLDLSSLLFCHSLVVSFFFSLNDNDNINSFGRLSLSVQKAMTFPGPWHGHCLANYSHHAERSCLGILVQPSSHLEWSGPVAALEMDMCLSLCMRLWCACVVLCCSVLLCTVCCGVVWWCLLWCCSSVVVCWIVIVVLLVMCLLGGKKRDITSMTVKKICVIVHRLHRWGFIFITVFLKSKNTSALKLRLLRFLNLLPKKSLQRDSSVIIFCQKINPWSASTFPKIPSWCPKISDLDLRQKNYYKKPSRWLYLTLPPSLSLLIFQHENVEGAGNFVKLKLRDLKSLLISHVNMFQEFMVGGFLAKLGVGIVSRFRSSLLATRFLVLSRSVLSPVALWFQEWSIPW